MKEKILIALGGNALLQAKEKGTAEDQLKHIEETAKHFLKIIKEGYLYKAVAASCAMPGIFEPIVCRGDILLDGGILSPLPVSTLRDYAHKIIAVNVTPQREELIKERTKQAMLKLNILDFVFGSIETMQRVFIAEELKLADVVIHPNLEGLHWREFHKAKVFIERGAQAAYSRIDDIKSLIEE